MGDVSRWRGGKLGALLARMFGSNCPAGQQAAMQKVVLGKKVKGGLYPIKGAAGGFFLGKASKKGSPVRGTAYLTRLGVGLVISHAHTMCRYEGNWSDGEWEGAGARAVGRARQDNRKTLGGRSLAGPRQPAQRSSFSRGLYRYMMVVQNV